MKFFLTNLIYFLIGFLIIFAIYIVFINRSRKKKIETKKIAEIEYLRTRFKLSTNKISNKKLIWITSIANSFIVAFVFVIIINIENIIIGVLVSFVLMMVLIYSIYEIVGRILNRKKKGSK